MVYGGDEVSYNKNNHIVRTDESTDIHKHETVNVDISLEEWQVIVNYRKWKGIRHTDSSQNFNILKITDTNHTTWLT